MEQLEPAFKAQKNIPIFFACNSQYLPIFSVALQSLVSHSMNSNNYDIWLLCSDINEIEKSQLQQIIKNNSNISLRIIDFRPFISQDVQSKLFLSRYISIEAYFRIFIPQVFNCYDKVLWLDSDIVIKEDVANLYNINIGNNWVAMALNIWTIYASNQSDIKPENVDLSFRHYITDFLGMHNPNNYCNDGIMIMNTKELRKNNFAQLCLDALKRIKTPNYWDQDLINIVCEKHNYILPLDWNHVWYMQDYSFLEGNISDELYKGYDKARHNPKIIHYAGSIKPWINPDKWLADDFWAEARKTPFYASIIINNTLKQLGYFTKNKGPFNPDWLLIYQILRFDELKKIKNKYKLLSKLHFLKKVKSYKHYANNLKFTLKMLKTKMKV